VAGPDFFLFTICTVYYIECECDHGSLYIRKCGPSLPAPLTVSRSLGPGWLLACACAGLAMYVGSCRRVVCHLSDATPSEVEPGGRGFEEEISISIKEARGALA